jgi:hypothetical protein
VEVWLRGEVEATGVDDGEEDKFKAVEEEDGLEERECGVGIFVDVEGEKLDWLGEMEVGVWATWGVADICVARKVALGKSKGGIMGTIGTGLGEGRRVP